MISKYELFSTFVSSMYHDIQRIERTEMAKYNLKGPYAQFLVAMSRYPEGITAARLCEICEKDKAAVSRTIVELEQAGLVRRKETHGIHYRVPLVLTQAGFNTAEQVKHLAALAVEQAGVGLEDEQRDTFYQVLGHIAQNLHTISRDGLQEKE